MDRRFDPAGPLRGTLRPPPDKSISHRAALIGAMGGSASIERYLDAADTRATLAAIETLGAEVQAIPSDNAGRHPLALDVVIRGRGMGAAEDAEVDVGNAGTLLRILPGWLAGQEGGRWTLDGDESIRRRPIDRVAEPLRQMGAQVDCREGRFAPLRIEGARLEGIEYRLPIASAQVKSCVLLAGVFAHGRTTVIEPTPTRDHTERMLEVSGAEIEILGNAISVRRPFVFGGLWVSVPGDFSSAAFALTAAAIIGGSEIELQGVGVNPTRIGLLSILERMGVRFELGEDDSPLHQLGAMHGIPKADKRLEPSRDEPVGRIRVASSELKGTEVGGEEVPLTIDELPLVALAGCFAEGQTVIRDAGELRHKESDRIAAVCEGLAAIGGEVEPTEDGMVVRGTGGLRGGTLDARGDHRLAMLGAVAGLASREGVTVRGFEAAEVSYPGFESSLGSLLAG
jgi:3-phosphoshikimate 1-carboxyvinyltransferase